MFKIKPPVKVITPQIADGSITEEKLADGAVTEAKIADGAVSGAKLSIPKYKCAFNFEAEHFSSEVIAEFDTSAEAHAFKKQQEAENYFIELYDPDTLVIATISFLMFKGGVDTDYSGMLYYRLGSQVFALNGAYYVVLSGGKHKVTFEGSIVTIYEE